MESQATEITQLNFRLGSKSSANVASTTGQSKELERW